MRYVAERDQDGIWTCYQEGSSELATGGATAATAFRHSCMIYGHDPEEFESIQKTPSRVTFFLKSAAVTAPCSECGGSGRYVGLNLVDECAACGGNGIERDGWR